MSTSEIRGLETLAVLKAVAEQRIEDGVISGTINVSQLMDDDGVWQGMLGVPRDTKGFTEIQSADGVRTRQFSDGSMTLEIPNLPGTQSKHFVQILRLQYDSQGVVTAREELYHKDGERPVGRIDTRSVVPERIEVLASLALQKF